MDRSTKTIRAALTWLALLAGCGSDAAPAPAAGPGAADNTPAGVTGPAPATAANPAPNATGSAGAEAQPAGADPATPAVPAAMPSDAQPATPQSAAPQPSATSATSATGHVDYPDPRGACNINSGFTDDHACLLPPAPGEGLQIHIGPKDYTNAEEVAKYLMHPGEESSQCWTYRTTNESDVFYQSYVMSGRAGTHHILGSMLEGDLPTDQGFGRCADTREDSESGAKNLGPMPMATKPFMPRGQVAPENKNIAHRLPAHTLAEADMHYYNFTEHDILREIWINLYYAPPDTITGEMLRVRGMGGFGWSRTPIEPGTDNVYQYECPVTGNGRILSLLGHYHAHGRRFSASIKRQAGDIQKVFEMFDYRDPAGFEYDSVTQNPTFSDAAAGAVSGMLEVKEGDILAWECHIVNDSDVPLRYTNEVNTGEMCNLWGQSFGITEWNCLKN